MTDLTGRQEPSYQLEVSRIFTAPPAVVRRAFTDASLRARWVPAGARPVPDPSEPAADGPLAWIEDLGRTVRIELHDEPGGKTRLELRAGPYSEAGESDARAWWNSAFSHLDTELERLG